MTNVSKSAEPMDCEVKPNNYIWIWVFIAFMFLGLIGVASLDQNTINDTIKDIFKAGIKNHYHRQVYSCSGLRNCDCFVGSLNERVCSVIEYPNNDLRR